MARKRERGLSRILPILDEKPRSRHNVTRFAGGRGGRKLGARIRRLGWGLPLTSSGMGRGVTRRPKGRR